MSQRDRLLDHLRRVALQGLGERRTDGQLLEHFISQRDEGAFALLLRRHGAMVWSVCRRVLGNAHDADDAFQAAFLVLVRRADSVRPREAVGNWLYGVAYRTALEARCRIARRRAKELPLQDVQAPESRPEDLRQELWPVLDRELSRLADKYRLPIVLCDLEGRSRKEVAKQLAIPEGTLSSRLATARKKLAARLTRLGFAVSGASLAVLLTENAATAGIAPALFSTMTKAALLVAARPAAIAGVASATVSSLTEGVLKTMFIAKIKMTALVLCSVAVLGAGTGGVYYQTRVGAADPQRLGQVVQDNSKGASEPGEREIDKLRRENEQLRKTLEEERRRAEALRIKFDELLKPFQAGVAPRPAQQAPPPLPPLHQDLKKELDDLASQRDDLKGAVKRQLETLERQKENIESERRRLEEEFRKGNDYFARKMTRVETEIQRRSQAAQTNQRADQQSAGTDKFDQILDRLYRLEQRLDRLETGGRPIKP